MTTMWRNGVPAGAGDAADLAFAGFAHFTAMQVREGAVRGLDLHLRRLRDASRELFGRALDEAVVRDRMRQALVTAPPAVSMTVTVHAAEGEFAPAEPDRPLEVTVRVGAASDGPAGPLALDVVEHERFLPHVKHVGEGAKTYHLRAARAAGFDDAAFVDRSGRLSEATIWNLAFSDGGTVVWPRAGKLDGTTMQILQRQLHRAGVPQQERDILPGDLSGLSAVVMNSWTPAVPVSRIGTHRLEGDTRFVEILRDAFAAEVPARP